MIQKESVNFSKDLEGICGLQKGLTHQLHHDTEKTGKKIMIFGPERVTQTQ